MRFAFPAKAMANRSISSVTPWAYIRAAPLYWCRRCSSIGACSRSKVISPARRIRFHGVDPATDLIEVEADAADGTVSMAALERAIALHGSRLALVLCAYADLAQAFAAFERESVNPTPT